VRVEPQYDQADKSETPPRILVLFGSAAVFGAERGNLEALTALRARGAEILCLIRDDNWSTVVPQFLDTHGINWWKVPYIEQWRRSRAHVVLLRGPWALIKANLYFFKAIREFKPTHIHSYGIWFTFNFLPGLKLVSTPLVFRAGDEPISHNLFWRKIWRYLVKRTSRFVANSHFVANSLLTHGVEEERVTIIYNSPPSRPETRSSEKVQPVRERQTIAYIGQIAEHKGPHLLIEAFKLVSKDFPNAKLVLAGRIDPIWEGDAWARSLMITTGADAQLKDRVQFLGHIEDIDKIFLESSFAVVPSLFDDPSPNVIMEAKLAGRSVIGFSRGGIPELITHGVDGLICEEATALALASAIRCYLNDFDLCVRHGKASRCSLDDFRISQFAEKWIAVYQSATLRPTRLEPRQLGCHKASRAGVDPGTHG
jgi:glycosyltransferase involved in cell wall biosynthesis